MATAERSRSVVIVPTVRVWDENMELRGSLPQAPNICDDDRRSVTLSLDDEIAAWLYDDSRRGAFLTVDEHDGKGRWLGRLDHWKIGRVGDCKECAHCMQKQLVAVWVTA